MLAGAPDAQLLTVGRATDAQAADFTQAALPSLRLRPIMHQKPLPLMKPAPSHAVPLDQALKQAPVLAGLMERVAQSSAMLRHVRPLIPSGIEVRAGPVEDGQWCLLVSNNAGAAKIRQLVPALTSSLRSAGWPTERIRIKVSTEPRSERA